MEHRLFDPDNPPEWLDPEWWRDRPHCNHLGSPTGAHVARLNAAANLTIWASDQLTISEGYGPISITDLGAGDGALLELMGRRPHAWGYEIIRADVKYAREVRNVEVHLRNVQRALVGDEPTGSGLVLGEVVVLTEVLEHMADPHGFLDKLAERKEVRWIVASSPWQETPEQHEWNHAWVWDTTGYAELFGNHGWEVVEHECVEWSQLIAARVQR